MNYIHSYHAGNFADCFKHLVLLAHVERLLEKETSFFFLDTHAGAGLYNLQSTPAQKTKEYQNGIQLLWNARADKKPYLVKRYLEHIDSLNPNGQLVHFPGSPLVVKSQCRPQDRIAAVELNNGIYKQLDTNTQKLSNVAAHQMDGYQSLKALLPPAENRGLVLVDPSFETVEEWRTLTHNLIAALKRWPNGHYVIWYPIKEATDSGRLQRKLKAAGLEQTMVSLELQIRPASRFALYANGVLLINPPWKVSEKIGQELIPFLSKLFKQS